MKHRSYREAGVADGHHDLSHHGGDALKHRKLTQIDRFHVAQFAHLLGRLKQAREEEGTLLDHCLIVYGSGIGDGDRHSHENLPILLAGTGNGTVRTGRHVAFRPGTPLTNLHLTLLDRMGVRARVFGDSNGLLDLG
jgi:hypothetical protein